MSSKPVVVHVGYHKTATTWLQSAVFRPRHGFHSLLSTGEIFDGLIAPHCLDFDPVPLAALVAARRAGLPTAATGVISLEALSGLPYDGGRESVIYAARLKAVLPEARILITIREQIALLASIYMQHLARAGTLPPRRFFAERPYRGYMAFSHRHVLYDRLVAHYQGRFGSANVFVLPMEMIAADQGAAVDLLARFADNTVPAPGAWDDTPTRNVSYPQIAVPLLRRINHLRSDALNPHPMVDFGPVGRWIYRAAGGAARRLPATFTQARPLTAHIRRRYAGAFADSNRRLATILTHAVDLTGYEGIDAAQPPARLAQ